MAIKIVQVEVKKGTSDIIRFRKDNGDNVGVAELQQENEKNITIQPPEILDKDGNVKNKVDDKIKGNKIDLKVVEVDE